MKAPSLLLLSLLVIISACQTPKKPVKDYFVISGTIKNLKKRNISLLGYNFDHKIKVDKKTGNFQDTIRIQRDGIYNLVFNKKQKPIKLLLSKTNDTKLIFDAKDLDAAIFDGKHNVTNTYLFKKSKQYTNSFESATKLYRLNEQDFLDKVETYKDDLTDLAIASQLPPEVLKKEVKYIDYEIARIIKLYEENHSIVADIDDFKVSEDFPSSIATLDLNNSDAYMNSFDYNALLNSVIKEKTQNNTQADEDYYLKYLETVQTEVSDSLIKNNLLFTSADKKSGIAYAEDLKQYYTKFMQYSSNETHKSKIAKSYETLKTIAKGKTAPKFNDYVNYNGGTTSFDDLLGKGKYLYIDVWATWCGFCKTEIPLLKMLEEEYHDKNIEFVSINVDVKDNFEKWKETIEVREMTGIQLFSGQRHEELPWAKNFIIKGLPRFIIVDPNGKIVSSNAPRPSQGEKLINMFDKLGI